MLKTIFGAALSFALAGPALAQTAQVNVTIDTSKPGAEIDRHIYGQFAEHLGHGIYEGIWVGENSKIPNIHGYRSDVVAALKKLRTGGYRCVIVDLAKRGLAVGDVMASLPPADPPHVIAFGAHVDVNRLDEARDAGCDQVFVRSRFRR